MQLDKYLSGSLLEKVDQEKDQLIQGQSFKYKEHTYHVQMVQTTFDRIQPDGIEIKKKLKNPEGEDILVFLMQSPNRLFSEIYNNKEHCKLKNPTKDAPPLVCVQS